MHKKNKVLQIISEQKLLPLYYHESEEVSVAILNTLFEAGIRIVEYTNRGANALQNFKALKKEADKNMSGLHLGIGTIKTRKQAKKFIDAGADFIICPTINEEVAEIVQENNLLWIPGCMTPTEIARAEECAAEIIKIFPGTILGPSYITAIKEIFQDLKFIPTGGVEPEENNLREWFSTGVTAVGMGSKLISKELIRNKDYNGLRDFIIKVKELVIHCSQINMQ